MYRTRALLPLCAAVLALLVLPVAWAPTARADDAPKQDDISEKIKAQMEKILRLMDENQKALLDLSTGGNAKPKRVDVEVPTPPSPDAKQGEAGPDAKSGKRGESATEKGKRVGRQLEELVKTTGSGAKKIPSELEELLRMIPT